MLRQTGYFQNVVLRKRPYLTLEICAAAIRRPLRVMVQPDGRIRFWARCPALENRMLRVITLGDRRTIHNAFLDRGFDDEAHL